MTKFTTAIEMLNNVEAYVGNVIGATVRGCGSQWVKLLDINEKGDKVQFTIKMITHNAHVGIKKVTVAKDKRVSFQLADDFLKWCKNNGIESNY